MRQEIGQEEGRLLVLWRDGGRKSEPNQPYPNRTNLQFGFGEGEGRAERGTEREKERERRLHGEHRGQGEATFWEGRTGVI